MNWAMPSLAAGLAGIMLAGTAQAALMNIVPVAAGTHGYEMTAAFDDQPPSLDFTFDANKQIYINEGGGAGTQVPSYTPNRTAWFDFGENWQDIRIDEVWVSYNAWATASIVNLVDNEGWPLHYPRMWWDDDNDNDDTDANAVASTWQFYNSIPKNTGEFQWVKDSDFTAEPYALQGRYLLVGSTDIGSAAASRVYEWVFVAAVIPEPSMLMLMGMALPLAMRRRR